MGKTIRLPHCNILIDAPSASRGVSKKSCLGGLRARSAPGPPHTYGTPPPSLVLPETLAFLLLTIGNGEGGSICIVALSEGRKERGKERKRKKSRHGDTDIENEAQEQRITPTQQEVAATLKREHKCERS